MKVIKAGKIIIIILFILFLATQLYIRPDSKADFNNVEQATIANIDMSNMVKQDNLGIKRYLSLSPEQYTNIAYYKISDTMKACEVVIVQFKSDDQAAAFKEAMDTRISNQKNIFDGYIQSESDLLNNAIIDVEANYAIYAVGDNAATMVSQFKEAL